MYLGDFTVTGTVYIPFTTNDSNGGRAVFSASVETGDFRIYRDSGLTEWAGTGGVVINEEFDSLVGVHLLTVDLSDTSDANFFATGHDYFAVLYPDTETVDSQNVSAILGLWSIGNRSS